MADLQHNMLRIPLDSKGHIPYLNNTYGEHFKTRFVNGDHELHKEAWPKFSKITGNIDGVSKIETEEKCCVYIYCKHQSAYNDPNRNPPVEERGWGTSEAPYVAIGDALRTASCYFSYTCWNIKIILDPESDKVKFPASPSFVHTGTERLWIVGNDSEIEGNYVPFCIVSGFKHNGGERLSGFIFFNCQINNVVSLSCSYFVDSVFNNTKDNSAGVDGIWSYNSKLTTAGGGHGFSYMYKTEILFTSAGYTYNYRVTSDLAYECSISGSLFDRGSYADEDPDDDLKVVVMDCDIKTAVKSSFLNCRSLNSSVMKDVSYSTEAQSGFTHYFFESLVAKVMNNVSVNINIPKLRIPGPDYMGGGGRTFGIAAILKSAGSALSNVSASVNVSQVVPMPSDFNVSGGFITCEVAENANNTGSGVCKCLTNCKKIPYRSGNASAPDMSKISCDKFYI